MKTLTLLLCFGMFLIGCAPIKTFEIELDSAEITKKEDAYFFQYAPESVMGRSKVSRDYVKLNILSKKNIYQYLAKDWGRIIQTRCEVSCDSCLYSSSLAAFGPYYGDFNIPYYFTSKDVVLAKNENGLYEYSIFTFRDLEAPEHNIGGNKVERVSAEKFNAISCYIIGVTKAPVLFPRSNSISISNREFRTLQGN